MINHALLDQRAEMETQLAADLTKIAVLNLQREGDAPIYPRSLRWNPCALGLYVETDLAGMVLDTKDGGIEAVVTVSRMIRPEFNFGVAGNC